MNSLATIVPIFSIIFIGWGAHRKGFLPQEFIAPANRIVFYMAIPAMIFRAVAKTDFTANFQPVVTTIALFSMLAAFTMSWSIGYIRRMGNARRGSFIQTSFHCNIGYLALAVAYYYLGEKGLAQAGMLAGFVMILQNFLAVSVLSLYGTPQDAASTNSIFPRIFGNPVILSAAAGMLFSFLQIPVPIVIDRCLKILGDMALPTALLIIGASLSFRLIRNQFYPILLAAGFIKLLMLPALAFFAYRISGIPQSDFLPAIILLASPTATVTYVMAKEMGGDADFSVGAISTSTLLSIVTLTFWLRIAA